MWEDPIVSDVRRVRDELCAQFDYDVKVIFADIRRRQVLLGDRLVRPRKGREDKTAHTAELDGGPTPV